jgi:hypothetical protein
MNDEQQLWRDVQKFMNQFPGFITVAKKIGQIGDLESWQAAEQRKLDAITQEIEKQRQAIKIERDAVNVEVERKLQESEDRLKEHHGRMQAEQESVSTASNAIIQEARSKAHKIVDEAKAKAKEITDGVAMTESRKTELEQQIADLMDAMLAVKNEHEATVGALAATKNQHAEFIKQIIGTGG